MCGINWLIIFKLLKYVPHKTITFACLMTIMRIANDRWKCSHRKTYPKKYIRTYPFFKYWMASNVIVKTCLEDCICEEMSVPSYPRQTWLCIRRCLHLLVSSERCYITCYWQLETWLFKCSPEVTLLLTLPVSGPFAWLLPWETNFEWWANSNRKTDLKVCSWANSGSMRDWLALEFSQMILTSQAEFDCLPVVIVCNA